MGIRQTQLMGLPERAETFLRLNGAYELVSCGCPHCSAPHINRAIREQCGDATAYGMFDDGPLLYRHRLKDGRWLEEYVQEAPWSSGPCIFLALKYQDTGEPLALSLWPDEAHRALHQDEGSRVMKRTVYVVAYDREDEGWFWYRRDQPDVKYWRSLKNAALQEAVLAARANQPSQLIIKGKNGRIQEERTYGRDPKRHKG